MSGTDQSFTLCRYYYYFLFACCKFSLLLLDNSSRSKPFSSLFFLERVFLLLHFLFCLSVLRHGYDQKFFFYLCYIFFLCCYWYSERTNFEYMAADDFLSFTSWFVAIIFYSIEEHTVCFTLSTFSNYSYIINSVNQSQQVICLNYHK